MEMEHSRGEPPADSDPLYYSCNWYWSVSCKQEVIQLPYFAILLVYTCVVFSIAYTLVITSKLYEK